MSYGKKKKKKKNRINANIVFKKNFKFVCSLIAAG